jgi:hypothetical protein
MSVILVTWEVEIGSILFKASLGKEFARFYLNQWLGVVALTCHLHLCREEV